MNITVAGTNAQLTSSRAATTTKPEAAPETESGTAEETSVSSQDQAEGNVLTKGLRWLDEYTRPRAHTGGNFEKASLFQAAFQGGTEGFYLWGLPGVAAGAGSAMTGVLVQNKTNSQLAGLITGTAVGAATGFVIAQITGNPMAIANGAVLGLFQTVRAHGESRVRDAGGNATMISAGLAGLGISGPTKIGGGLGAVAGVRIGDKLAQTEFLKDKPGLQKVVTASVGAASGAAAGAALAAIFNPPVGMATVIGLSAAAGAVGPFFGPRFSQFFRNLAEDLGKGVEKLLPGDKELGSKTRNAVGSLPASFIKEGIRGFQYSDGGLAGFILGGVMESVQQAQIALFSKDEAGEGTPAPEGQEPLEASAPAEAPEEKAA